MKTRKLAIECTQCQSDELCTADFELVEAAKNATYTSYAPYSHFYVGAAVRLENGEIFTGSNQENAAFGAGTCAERCALHFAQAAYPNVRVVKIAIAARGKHGDFTKSPISPCGICRQALMEAQTRAQGRPIEVLLYGADEILLVKGIQSLLPFAFDEIE